MMHRHDKLRTGGVCHFNRLLRRAMRSDPRIVGANRHDPEIEGAALAQFGKTVRQCGVPSKKNAPSISVQEIAVVTTVSIALLPRAPVFHAQSDDINFASGSLESRPLIPTKLRDVA